MLGSQPIVVLSKSILLLMVYIYVLSRCGLIILMKYILDQNTKREQGRKVQLGNVQAGKVC